MLFLQRRQNQALAEYVYEREELLARVDALSREILALRAQMVSDDVSAQSAPFQQSPELDHGIDRPTPYTLDQIKDVTHIRDVWRLFVANIFVLVGMRVPFAGSTVYAVF